MDVYERLFQQAEKGVASVGKSWHAEKRPPATQREIDDCQQLIGVALPEDYRALLMASNGMTLGIQRRELVRYEIALLGTGEIVERTAEHSADAHDAFPEESFDSLIVFADTMDGDICLFDRSQERDGRVPVLGGNHEDDPDGWRRTIIAADFDQWYRNVLTFVAEYGNHDDFRYWWARDWSLRP